MLRLGEIYPVFKYVGVNHIDPANFVWITLMKLIFVIFLWQKTVIDHFSISENTRKKTTIIIVMAGLVLNLISFIIYAL
jgi:hypothetical protein